MKLPWVAAPTDCLQRCALVAALGAACRASELVARSTGPPLNDKRRKRYRGLVLTAIKRRKVHPYPMGLAIQLGKRRDGRLLACHRLRTPTELTKSGPGGWEANPGPGRRRW